jgi:hypothetical protein
MISLWSPCLERFALDFCLLLGFRLSSLGWSGEFKGEAHRDVIRSRNKNRRVE